MRNFVQYSFVKEKTIVHNWSSKIHGYLATVVDVFITKFNTEVDTVFFLYNYHARKLMKPLINNKAAIYFNLDEIIALVRKRIIDLRIVQILSI